jgi:selenocysteine lyase/cysteine desulfurase
LNAALIVKYEANRQQADGDHLNIDLVRKEIPVTARRAYFDNAGTGPPSIGVLNAIHEYLTDWRDYGENWEEWLPTIIESRRLFGKMIGASTDEVASLPNVSSALIALASSIKYKPNGNIVVSELNFPTNIYLWHLQKRHGRVKDVRLLRRREDGIVPLEQWQGAIDDDTSIVSVDYVSWANGCREKVREIAKIAHEHDAFLIADSFHGLGVFPINAKQDDVDALVCGMYKWMQGPHGAAYLYARRDKLDELDPNYVGWHGVEDSVVRRMKRQEDLFGKPFNIDDAQPASDATRFEGGSWGVVSIIGAKAALEYALKHDQQERFHRILKVTEHLIDGLKRKGRRILTPLLSDRRSGIVVFEDADPRGTFEKLKSLNITVASRVKAIRVSPHYYNTEDEIDKLLAAL